MVVNTEMLNGLIDSSGLKREYIAKRIGISRQALYSKINNDTDFTISEVVILCDVLGIKKLSERNAIFFMGK